MRGYVAKLLEQTVKTIPLEANLWTHLLAIISFANIFRNRISIFLPTPATTKELSAR